MDNNSYLDINKAKRQAKALKKELRKMGTEIKHCHALNLVARSQGYKDWNVYIALANRTKPPLSSDDLAMRIIDTDGPATIKQTTKI